MSTPASALYEPYQAARWLLSRHDHAEHLVTRVGAWLTRSADDGVPWPDLDMIAQGINAVDQYGVEWKAYEEAHPAPRISGESATDEYLSERRYEEWEKSGPRVSNPFASSYLPMSGGEKRFFRMLAVLSPGHRVAFHLDDTSGVSLRCCTAMAWGAPPPHRSFVQDWAGLIAGDKVAAP